MKTPDRKLERSGDRGVAAFFDIDGTLVAAPSLEWRLAMRLAMRGELRAAGGVRWLGRVLGAAVNEQSRTPAQVEMFDRNKAWLSGVDCSSLEGAARAIARCASLIPIVLRRLQGHAAQGHKIFLVSGTLAPIARALSQRLATVAEIEVCATEVELKDGTYTGRVVGESVCGPEKAAAVQQFAARHNLDLAKSYAYANAIGDRWFLEAVGNPVVVAADRALRSLARERGWASLQSVAPARSGGGALCAGEGSLHA